MAAGVLLSNHFPLAAQITKPLLWITGDGDQFHSVSQSKVAGIWGNVSLRLDYVYVCMFINCVYVSAFRMRVCLSMCLIAYIVCVQVVYVYIHMCMGAWSGCELLCVCMYRGSARLGSGAVKVYAFFESEVKECLRRVRAS